MDNRNRNSNVHLGINKFGKNIKKSPLHHPNNNNFTNPTRNQPQPLVYNINKNDFRNVVQQLTGSPARDPNPRPVNHSPKPQSQRLQKIRPPPLTPFARPPHPGPMAPHPGPMGPYPGPMGPILARSTQYPPPGPNIAESPVSLYMRYLQNSITDTGPGPGPGQTQFGSGGPGLLPTPPGVSLSSPRIWGALPSPNSQFLLPSPSGFLNLMSPRSPYPPLLSPNYRFPPPLSPSFGFPQMNQNGILGPGPQPPPSPGFFPVSSPRWRDQKS